MRLLRNMELNEIRFLNYYHFNFQNIMDAAVEEYKKATKKNTEVTIDEQFLGSDW